MRMLAWAGVVLGAVYLIYIGGGWWGIYSPYLRIVTMAIAAVVLATWAFVAWRNPAWRPRTALWPAIAACLGSLAISTLFSRVPRVSLEYLGYAIVLAALYLVFVRLFADPFFRRRLATLFSMLFVVTAALYIATVVRGWIDWWSLAGLTVPPLRPGYGGLTYNNPSAVLTMVALLGVPVVATYGRPTRHGAAAIAGVVVTVGLVALMSGSRSGWFALGLTAVIAVVAWLAVPRQRAEVRSALAGLLGRRSGQVALAGALVGVVAVGVVLGPGIIRRATEGGETLRLSYAVAATRMFADSPIVGTGPGTWVIQRPGDTLAGEPDYYIPHAHNLEVQALAELGLVGALAGAVLVISLLRLFLPAMRGPTGERRRWAWAGAIGLTYFVLHQVLDFYVNMPAFLFASVIPVAYLDATRSATSTATDREPAAPEPAAAWTSARRGVAMVSAAVVAASIAGLTLQEIPAKRHEEAVARATDRDWAAADPLAREAASMDPDIGSYQFTAGLTAAWVGDHAASAAYFRNVVARNDLPEAWLNLAAEQLQLGDAEDARESLTAALRLGDQRQAVTMAAGDLALRLGDRETAIRVWSRAIAGTPSLAADSWWRGDPDRAAVYDELISRATELAPTNAWEILLMAGRPGQPPSELARLVQLAWLGDQAAREELLLYCADRPIDLYALSWCARTTVRGGEIAISDEFRVRISMLNLSSGFSTGEMRVGADGMTGDQLLGEPADLWATYTYRRPAPWDVLVPSLVHLTLE